MGAEVYAKYFPFEEYYNKVVVPVNRRRFHQSGDMFVCPMHDDHDPSLGVIRKKNGIEVCHCFGCNYWGDVVKFHQSFCQKYLHRYMSSYDVLKDLSRIFGVDYESLPKGSGLEEDKQLRQENEMLKAFDDFDIGDYKYMISKGKKEKKGIAYYNTLMMIMTAKVKESE